MPYNHKFIPKTPSFGIFFFYPYDGLAWTCYLGTLRLLYILSIPMLQTPDGGPSTNSNSLPKAGILVVLVYLLAE
jgi:hypothetical protein